MTTGIKKMLAERAKAEADKEVAAKLEKKWDYLIDETMALVDKAAPSMDEGSDETKWAPSAKLKIYFFVAATSESEGAEKRAMLFVLKMIDKARALWIDGFIADPWAEVPRRRA
jgi:hypothetical protein